jgi:HTH-type transcriptional regulator/antitoxin HigA
MSQNHLSDASAYLDLLAGFPPRPIANQAQLQETQEVINLLLDKESLSQNEQDYLNVLGTLVSEYEEIAATIPDIYGVELLKVLLEERNIRQKDLVHIFKTESIISAILNGHRRLTVEHIQKLAEYFHVSPAAFFPVGQKTALEP